jgi:RNA recognition motif-containing protein
MSVKLYVGNIPWRTSTEELRDLFAQFGNVEVGSRVVADLCCRTRVRARFYGCKAAHVCLDFTVYVFRCFQDCFIPQDRESGRPRGFAFVTMASGSDQAIQSLNETEFQVGLGCIQYRCCCPDTQAALALLRSDIKPVPLYVCCS